MSAASKSTSGRRHRLAALRDQISRTPRTALAFGGSALLSGACVAAALSLNALRPPPPPLPPAIVEAPLAELAVRPAAGNLAGGCQIVVEVDDAAAELLLFQVGVDRTVSTWTARPSPSKAASKGSAHRFSDLGPGTYHVNARVSGKALVAAPTWSCDGKGERADFKLATASSSSSLTGRVVGWGKRAVPGAEVLIAQPQGHETTTPGVLHVPLAADGSFTALLRPGRYEVLAAAPHHVAQKRALEVAAAEGAQVKLNVRLDPSPVVAGVVVDQEGKPVPGAVVSLGGIYDPKAGSAAVVADDQGRYELPIPMGSALTVVARGAGKLGRTSVAAVVDPAGVAGVELVVEAGRRVSGLVMTQRGEPHAFAPVRFRVRALGLTGVEKTDARGAFVLDGMPAVDDVEVWADGNAIGAWGGAVASPGADRVLLTWVPPAY